MIEPFEVYYFSITDISLVMRKVIGQTITESVKCFKNEINFHSRMKSRQREDFYTEMLEIHNLSQDFFFIFFFNEE